MTTGPAAEPVPDRPAAPAAGDAREAPHGPAFWAGLAVGTALMAHGVRGLLDAAPASRPANFAGFFLGAGVVHDAVLAPLAVAVGWATRRAVPGRARNPVRVALALSALLVAFAWPLVRRWGARPANPSLLPDDYGRNLVVALAVIWVVTAVIVVVRVLGARRGR